MRHSRSGFALALSLSAFLLPTGALAQVLGPPVRPVASVLWVAPRGLPPNAIPLRIDTEEKHDHTVLGLVLGAGLGFVAGWGFYNAMCEAVDNDCADSRWPYLAIGTGVGGGLGTLIGSVAR